MSFVWCFPKNTPFTAGTSHNRNVQSSGFHTICRTLNRKQTNSLILYASGVVRGGLTRISPYKKTQSTTV